MSDDPDDPTGPNPAFQAADALRSLQEERDARPSAVDEMFRRSRVHEVALDDGPGGWRL